MSVTDFLLARITEDEATIYSVGPEDADIYYDGEWSWQGITSTRLEAECQAKRAIIAECSEDHEHAMTSGDDTTELASVVLYALAAVFADHPDYQEDWKP